MQDCATINLFLGTCMCVCAYIIPVMHSLDPPCADSSGQFVKIYHFEEFDVFD